MLRLIPKPLHRAIMPLAHRTRHVVRRLRKKPIAGCSVVITDLQGAILLLQTSYGPRVWTLPGGGIGRGETPEQAARREVQEEVGIALRNITALGVIEEEISGSPHTAHLFCATADVRPVADQREIVEARFFPPHSLPEPLGHLTRSRLALYRERRREMRGT